MGLSSYQLTDGAIESKGVVAAPDRLTGTAAENKAVFDRLVREAVKGSVNGIIAELSGSGGAAEIGAAEIAGVSGRNVQAALASLKAQLDEKADPAQAEAAADTVAAMLARRYVRGAAVNWMKGMYFIYEGKLYRLNKDVSGSLDPTNPAVATKRELAYDVTELSWLRTILSGRVEAIDGELADVEDGKASRAYTVGEYFTRVSGTIPSGPAGGIVGIKRSLHRVTAPIARGGTITPGANCEVVTIGGELNTRTPVYGGGVNLLDNWYFIGGGSQQSGGRFPINQREQTNYSGAATYFDRWKTLDGAAVASIEPDGITVATTIFQEIENIDSLLGKTLTFSALSADGLTAVTVIMPSTYPSTAATPHTDNGSTRVTLRYIAGSVRAYLGWKPGVTSPVKFYAAKLELGDTQTLAHQDAGGNWVLNDPPPNFQQELAKCQRYQVPIPIYSRYPVAYSPSENAFDFVIPVPVTMRSLPSIDYGAFEIRQNSSTASDFTFSCVLNQNGSILIRAAKANHGLTGFVTLYCVNNAMLSANL